MGQNDMETCKGVEVQLHLFLSFALNREEYSVSSPDHLARCEMLFFSRFVRGCVDPRGCQDAVNKEKCPCREEKPGLPIVREHEVCLLLLCKFIPKYFSLINNQQVKIEMWLVMYVFTSDVCHRCVIL
jgi:hypothetical protein